MTDEAIILAGGRGTRLRGVVSDRPKPLAPVAGRPFLAWLLDALAESGIRRIVLATGYLSAAIEQAVGSSWRGVRIAYSKEEHPLGTGGAIRLAAAALEGRDAHVVNGDTFLRYDPEALRVSARAAGAAVGMTLAAVPDVSRYGAVQCVGNKVVHLCEKGETGPGWINAGCYYLAPDAFHAMENLPQAFSFESDFLAPQVVLGRVAALHATRDFIDIGTPDDFHAAQQIFGGIQ